MTEAEQVLAAMTGLCTVCNHSLKLHCNMTISIGKYSISCIARRCRCTEIWPGAGTLNDALDSLDIYDPQHSSSPQLF